jgi:hypothetical protein
LLQTLHEINASPYKVQLTFNEYSIARKQINQSAFGRFSFMSVLHLNCHWHFAFILAFILAFIFAFTLALLMPLLQPLLQPSH